MTDCFFEKVDQISKKHLSNAEQLRFYGLYQQATIGNINMPKPWFYKHQQQLEWNAWNTHLHMTPNDAKKNFIIEADNLNAQRVWTELRSMFHVR